MVINKAVAERGKTIMKRLPSGPCRAAEIGVLRGHLSGWLLDRHDQLRLTMVDSWAAREQQTEAYKATGDEHAFHDAWRTGRHMEEALASVARFDAERFRILHGRSVDMEANVEDGSLDLVFLDGDHSYDGVRADIDAWLPKLAPGGYLGGHDYRNPDPRFRFGVTDAVDEWVSVVGLTLETDANFTWWVRL
ncbi:class I SAM-dependent methyltransferase [Martelella endophytica]|uniref:Methyltransferase n=1 Tax=Martelella endophytica TaxID=1486262 RepID=A0A0D5LKI8_MAREN|nr:class I SAM-dependent methyltransferase [Martelella endophytica]AJY44666.1 hypothetical protein TM49_01580 [Martelella endophytica]